MGRLRRHGRIDIRSGVRQATGVVRMLLIVLAMILLTWFVRDLAHDTMYVFLVAGVALVAWKDGWWLSAVAATLSILAVDLLFIDPIGSLRPPSVAALTQLLSLGFVAALMIGVVHALRRAQRRADEHAQFAQVARSTAEEVSNTRERFLRTLSHEVRTPINAVLGYADLLDSRAAGPLTSTQGRYVQRLHIAASHLLSVVNGVLEIASADEGHLPLDSRRVRVTSSIEKALDLVAPQADAKRIAVNMDRGDVTLAYSGDPDRVQQILVNLLGNAVKFTPNGGTIRVAWGIVPGRAAPNDYLPGRLFVRVTDNGPGIAAEDQQRIFEPFERATHQNDDSRSEGTGLGLSISRRLARLMRGDITVESTPGHGASFILYLPIDGVGAQRQRAGSLSPTAGHEHQRRTG